MQWSSLRGRPLSISSNAQAGWSRSWPWRLLRRSPPGWLRCTSKNSFTGTLSRATSWLALRRAAPVTVKIIDLGLAKAVNEPSAQRAISTPGGFAGTPEYASPEQFAGVAVDIRSDLYSLGVMLWEMATGRSPVGGSPAEVMYQHQHAPLPLEQLESVSQPVVFLLKTLLEKDPGRRLQNPAELLKVMPAVADAIAARRRIGRQTLQKVLAGDARSPAHRPLARQGPEKISVARLPVTGPDVLVGRRILLSWMLHGQTSR